MQDQAAAAQTAAAERQALMNSLDRQHISQNVPLLEAKLPQQEDRKPLENHQPMSANQQPAAISANQHQTIGTVPYLSSYNNSIQPPEPSPHHQVSLVS